jgi:predicted transcriptional regulator
MKDISQNYITIQGWMVQNLNLKSNDLLIFALIYGFCQDGETEFSGSVNYLRNWLNCSRPTVSKSLEFLVAEKLIEKRTIYVNNVTFNRYKISLQGVKKLYGGSKETLQGGSKETLHHNTNINTIIIEKENSAIVVEYPDIDFEPIKTTIELKNEYKSNPILSIAPIITIETFIKDCMQDKMWVESIIRPNKLTEDKMILALKEYELVCNGRKKVEPKTMNKWKEHFFNWINYVLRESRK